MCVGTRRRHGVDVLKVDEVPGAKRLRTERGEMTRCCVCVPVIHIEQIITETGSPKHVFSFIDVMVRLDSR